MTRTGIGRSRTRSDGGWGLDGGDRQAGKPPTPTRSGQELTPFASADHVRERFRSTVLARSFPCLGAKAVMRVGAYEFGLYPELASREATSALARDLTEFLNARPRLPGEFQSYVACFRGRPPADELSFESRLWEQLQRLHDLDAPRNPWDPAVSSDPADPRFSFSFGGTAFFVIGLHPASSRAARRFDWPTLVFNPHDQFTRLRQQCRFERFRDVIRWRDLALHGSLNPNVTDHGTDSEARQYSGRAVERDWRCPFHPGT